MTLRSWSSCLPLPRAKLTGVCATIPSVCGAETGAQGLMPAKQVLCQLSILSSPPPFCISNYSCLDPETYFSFACNLKTGSCIAKAAFDLMILLSVHLLSMPRLHQQTEAGGWEIAAFQRLVFCVIGL